MWIWGRQLQCQTAQRLLLRSKPRRHFLRNFEVDGESAIDLTAIQAGINAQDPAAVQSWLNAPITTRKDGLETIRNYHTGVIRTEMWLMIYQIEGIVKNLNDRILRQHEHLRWPTSDSSQEQKKQCAMQVLLNGFEQTMSPEERLYMIPVETSTPRSQS